MLVPKAVRALIAAVRRRRSDVPEPGMLIPAFDRRIPTGSAQYGSGITARRRRRARGAPPSD